MRVSAQSTANGLPAYTDGYAKWTKLNRKPVTTPGAHNGIKNIYASRKRLANRKFPNGTVIVKSIATPGESGLPSQVAVMRKVAGRWRWVEYGRSGSRYDAFAQGQICTSCHVAGEGERLGLHEALATSTGRTTRAGAAQRDPTASGTPGRRAEVVERHVAEHRDRRCVQALAISAR